MSQVAKDAAKFLKSTLRLPAASFPARPPPSELAKYLPRCTDDLYSWQRRERPSSNLFTLHDGPPYANGDLHVGHALNKIVKDIVCRCQLAKGKRIDYVPGWDCHGLPIELKALEHHGWKRGQGVDPVSIREAARSFAQAAVEKQMNGFRSWAVMGDWENHWKTMDKDFELRQLKVFQAMAEHELIYRRHKPVYWSPSSGTALAEAELEFRDDHISTAALIKFPLRNFRSDPTFAVIWTTTPWTLPANQAIAVNRSLQYSVVRSKSHGRLVVAHSRLAYLEQLMGEHFDMVEETIALPELLCSTYDGHENFGPQCFNRPIFYADFVTADSGTGLVHCAPGHGMEDYVALQPLIQDGRVVVRAPVDRSGDFDASATPEAPSLLCGKFVFNEGNEAVLEMLSQAGLLLHRSQYKHKYPIDWRTKEPVIILATAQWFADISSIKKDAVQALENVSFLPDTGKSRIQSFVENRSEWCISRQRSWGVPIPAIYHRESGAAVLSPASVQHILNVIRNRGIDAWWSDPVDDPAWIVDGLSPAHYRRGTDTMDVWFDSGTSWALMGLNGAKQNGPLADVYLEGTDQHRGWFQSSLLTDIAYQKSVDGNATVHAPFKLLVTHGFTLDAQGKKMSKSLGNVIAPSEIIAGVGPISKPQHLKPSKKQRENHPLGPDALRLWAAGSDWTRDVVVSDTVIKTVHTSLDKYRVTIKLLLGLLQDFSLTSEVSYAHLSTLDRMALLQLHSICAVVRRSFSDFEFHKAVTALNRWIVSDLSGFYFEAVKDIVYCDSPASARRLSAQTTLHHIFLHLQSMLGPITPLLVEESWDHTPDSYKDGLEHPLRRIWTEPPAEWHDPQLADILPVVNAVNSAVKAAQEKARAEKLIGQSLACDVTLLLESGSGLEKISRETWSEILVVSEVHIQEQSSKPVAEVVGTKSQSSWLHTSSITGADGKETGVAAVTSPQGGKCARCWKYVVQPKSRTSIDAARELELCQRCEDAVTEFKGSH